MKNVPKFCPERGVAATLVFICLILLACGDTSRSPAKAILLANPTPILTPMSASAIATSTPAQPSHTALPQSATGMTALVPALPQFRSPEDPMRSTRMIVGDEALWAGHPASLTVSRLDLPDGLPAWQTNVGCQAATMAQLDSRLFVACFDSGEIVVLDHNSGEVLDRSLVGHGPFGLIGTSGHLFLTLAHEDAILILHPDTLTEVARAETAFQPRGLALYGNRLYVVHLYDASVRIFDPRSLELLGNIKIGLQSALAESITLDPQRMRAYVPHQRQNFTNLTRLFDNTVFPVVSALDTEELRPVRREALALDSLDAPVGMPSAAVLGQEGERLYIANGASDDVSVIDLGVRLGAGHITVGHNPRDIALSPDGSRLYTLNLVSDDISVIDTEALAAVGTFPLGNDPRPGTIQQGERLFFTSRPDTIARDNWIACASCHFDGGFDAQTWLGAEGGPRNTTILRGIENTLPLHWSADRPDVQSFQETFQRVMAGTGLQQSGLDALSDFLNSLSPLASPLRRADGELTASAIEGASVFQDGGCEVCHSPPLFTDQELHEVGTSEPFYSGPSQSGKVLEKMGPAFDTPSLRELWLTAPYFHDGRASTLRDMLTTLNRDGQHGDTSEMSEDQLTALEIFLMSLPLTPQESERYFGQ